MKFLNCVFYLAAVAVLGFVAGRLLPQGWIQPEKGIFRCFAFEKEGRLYEKLNIRKWQSRVPDMSRILPGTMPPKNLTGDYKKRLPVMIRETCVAELEHDLVSLAGLYCLWLWPGLGGILVTAVFIVLLNLPFILIQRYNRPRLLRLEKKLKQKEEL